MLKTYFFSPRNKAIYLSGNCKERKLQTRRKSS